MTDDSRPMIGNQQYHDAEMREQIVRFIEAFHQTNPYGPTVREIQSHLGVGSTSTVVIWLKQLRQRGEVDWVERSPRTIHLTG